MKIIESTKDNVFKIDSDMINLIGCNKENFLILLKLMQYKPKKTRDNNNDFFMYKPRSLKRENKKRNFKINKDSPFEKLTDLRFR